MTRMLIGEDQLREMDLKRRWAYTIATVILGIIAVGYTIHDVLTQDWANFSSSLSTVLVCLSIIIATHWWKVPTERLNYAIALGLLVVAVPEFLPSLQEREVVQGQYFSFILICALWFGLLSGPMASLLTLISYVAFSALVLTRPVNNPWLLLHLGGTMTVVGMVVSFGQQVSSKRQQVAKFQQQALTDPLTNLPNRRAVMQQLEELLAAPSASKTITSFALLMLDIDHFKLVNDRYTHTVGDQVLMEVGAALGSNVGTESIVARWGGEEFMVVLPNTTAHQAYAIAARLHGHTFELPGTLPNVNFSGGGVLSHEAATLEELLALADRRLHTAKNSGRNQVKWDCHLSATPSKLTVFSNNRTTQHRLS